MSSHTPWGTADPKVVYMHAAQEDDVAPYSNFIGNLSLDSRNEFASVETHAALHNALESAVTRSTLISLIVHKDCV